MKFVFKPKEYRYGEHLIEEDDINAVTEVLQSSNLTCGPKVEEFENLVRKRFKYNHALAVNSGTSALYLALSTLNLSSCDEVIVPSITFVATANVVLMCGAKVVFADVSEDTLLIDCFDVEKKITKNTKAVISVDMAGQLCDYTHLKNICIGNNLVLISDACHSIGLQHFKETEKPDFICYSFHPVKHITTGEGGMILTDNKDNYSYMKLKRTHGLNDSKNMIIEGFNFRMPDINAALGISQFKKLENFIIRRQYLAEMYLEKLGNYCLDDGNNILNHSYHLFIIKTNNREELRQKLLENNINTQIHYKPVYDNDFYKNNGYEFSYRTCHNTEEIKNKILTIPLYLSLEKSDIEYISKSILEFIK